MIKDILKSLTGGDPEAPVLKVGIDANSLINLYLMLTLSAATIMLLYLLIIHKNKN